MQKCEEMIVSGLPTFTMMNRGRPQDVDHFVAHENAPHRDEDGTYTTKRAIQAWKNYRLTLDPRSIEPNFLSVASLRTDTVRGNPELFRKNYDHIRFREYIEDNLAEQLDDETYYQFCGLKTLDWSEANIRRKFDWTQKMYDVALERFCTEMGVGKQPEALDTRVYAPEMERSAQDAASAAIEVLPVVSSNVNVVSSNVNAVKSHIYQQGQPHRTAGRILQSAHEPRVKIEPGWPKGELLKYGISVGEFCKEWSRQSEKLSSSGANSLYYKFAKTGQWVERHLKTAQAALVQLKKNHHLEPVGYTGNTEPELEHDSTEPVGVGT